MSTDYYSIVVFGEIFYEVKKTEDHLRYHEITGKPYTMKFETSEFLNASGVNLLDAYGKPAGDDPYDREDDFWDYIDDIGINVFDRAEKGDKVVGIIVSRADFYCNPAKEIDISSIDKFAERYRKLCGREGLLYHLLHVCY